MNHQIPRSQELRYKVQDTGYRIPTLCSMLYGFPHPQSAICNLKSTFDSPGAIHLSTFDRFAFDCELLYRVDLERSNGSQTYGYGTMKEIEEKPVEHEFSKDFLTGCLALIVIGLILFVLVPLLIFVLKLSVLVAVPIGLIAAFVIFTAFFGRIINILRRKW